MKHAPKRRVNGSFGGGGADGIRMVLLRRQQFRSTRVVFRMIVSYAPVASGKAPILFGGTECFVQYLPQLKAAVNILERVD